MDLHQNARSTPGLAAQSQQGGPPCCGRGAWRVCGSWSPLRPAVAINGPGRGAAVVGLLPIAPDGGTHRQSFLLSGTTCALEWPRSDLELEHESDTDRFLDRGRCVTAIWAGADAPTKRPRDQRRVSLYDVIRTHVQPVSLQTRLQGVQEHPLRASAPLRPLGLAL